MSNANPQDGEVAVDDAVTGNDKSVKTVKPDEVKSAGQIEADTAEQGNLILDMNEAQRQAYLNEVSEVKDRMTQAGKSYMVARWYIGRAAQKMRDDVAKNGGSTYGKATVEGFARDIGLGKSTVHKCIKIQERFTLKELQKTPISVDAADCLLSASPDVQQKVMAHLTSEVEKAADYRPSVSEVKSMVAAETEKHAEAVGGKAQKESGSKRANPFGTNSATGSSHKQVLGRFIKQVENLQGAGANLVVSLKEIPKDTDITDKAELTLLKMQEDTLAEVDSALKTLEAIKADFGKAKAARVDKEKELKAAEKEAEKAKAAEKEAKAKQKEAERAKKAAAKATKKSTAKKGAAKKSTAKKSTAKKGAKRSSGKSKLPGRSQRPAGGKT